MTIATTLHDSVLRQVDALASIELAEMDAFASLTERRDRKYIVDPADLVPMMRSLGPEFRALEIEGRRSFRYESVYFDTRDLDSYLMAARSRPHRIKVRTRSYLDSEMCSLEVKRRESDGITVKSRIPYSFENREDLDGEASVLLATAGIDAGSLHRTLVVDFVRATLVDTSTWSRTTLDFELVAQDSEGRSVGPFPFVLVETKTTGHPSPFDRILWEHHYRPVRISKYCTLMAAIDTTLPANKWNRTLRHHLGWLPHPHH